jgi:hypothetical protein
MTVRSLPLPSGSLADTAAMTLVRTPRAHRVLARLTAVTAGLFALALVFVPW